MKKFRLFNLLFILCLGITAPTLLLGQTNMDVNAFRTTFNNDANKMRVITINDPSCGGCVYMFQQEIGIFEDPSNCGMNSNIQYYFVWTKVLTGSTQSHAATHNSNYTDPRYTHYWDEFQLLGDRYMNTLNLTNPGGNTGYTAWHTAMCYAPGVTWNVNDTNPPAPTFYQHKLSTAYNADQNLYFDEVTFATGFNNIACALSVNELNIDQQLSIYPNPGREVGIYYNHLGSDASIVISDITGKEVQRTVLNNTNGVVTMNDGLHAGIYFCTLIEDGQVKGAKKFIISK